MSETLLLPYRLRTVRVGVQATFLVLAGLVFLPLLPIHPAIDTFPYLVLIALAAAGGAGVALLPWRRLFQTGKGMGFLYAWSVLDILLITAVIAVSGDARSHLFWLYVLTTFFMASSYPPKSQVALLAFTFVSYVGLLFAIGAPLVVGDLVARFAILGVLTFMASFLFRELMQQMTQHGEAHTESERRARHMAAVTMAAKAMNTLASEEVLEAVMGATATLGFDAAVLAVYDDDAETYRVVQARNIPEAFVREPHPATSGIARLVRERGKTVRIDDYASHPGSDRSLLEAGFRSGVAVPVRTNREITAALGVASRKLLPLTGEDVEALELLAAHAGQALENAERFEEQQRTVERLAELDQMKRNFVSNVSHELRTPLTAISGMGITLENRWNELGEERRRELLHRLNNNARALDEVIATLLDFSRLDAGRLQVRCELIDLTALVDKTYQRLQGFFAEGALTVDIEEKLTVSGDAKLLERVVENLITNAAKHTPAGTPVCISVRCENGHVAVAVVDEGPGIPPEDLPKLGQRFYRGSRADAQQTQGTGLGLALAREVLEMHGAGLELSNELRSGSRFGFRLPLQRTPDMNLGVRSRTNASVAMSG